MTQRFEIDTLYTVSIDKCLKYMADEGLNEHLSSLPGLSHRRVSALKSNGVIREWSVDVGWGETLPELVRRVIGQEHLHWTQSFRMNLDTLRMTFDVSHPFPSAVLEVSGEGHLSACGTEGCRVCLRVSITSRLPVVGRRLETLVAQKAKETMETDAAYRQDYIRKMEGEDP